MQLAHIISRDAAENRYHVDVIRERVTRALPVISPHVVDELRLALPEYIPTIRGSKFRLVTFTGSFINSNNAHRMDRG